MSTYKTLNQTFVLQRNKNDLNYLNGFFRGVTSDHYLINLILYQFHLVTGLFSGDSGECGSLLEKLYKCYYSVTIMYIIKLTWVVRCMVDAFHVFASNPLVFTNE